MLYPRHGSRNVPATGSLGLEALESRLNLSTLSSLPIPELTTTLPPRIVGAPSSGATLTSGTTSVSGATAVAIDSYSGISNCQVFYNNGQPVVGATSGSDGYVEYTVTAPAAGSYTVNVAIASPNGAGLRVLANGKAAPSDIWTSATDSWAAAVNGNVTVQLNAGSNVIRLSSLYATKYTLNSVTVSPVGLPATTPPAADTSAAPISIVRDQAWLALGSYGSAWNFALQQGQWGPAMVSTSSTGAYVEYTIDVANAGTYTVRSGIASVGGGTINLLDNGAQAGTYTISTTHAADSFAPFAQTLTLAAGRQTLRFSANPGTTFNLNSIEISRVTTVAPVTPVAPPVTTPAAPVAVASNPVTVNQRWMNSFMELDITGTAGDDVILLSQDGTTLTISSGGKSQTVTGNFGEIVIHGGGGNDTLNVASSVTAATRLYGDAGNDTLLDLGQGKATLVGLDGAADTLTGNGINTSYWGDAKDVINASAQEVSDGRVHTITGFYQPFTSDPASSSYITATPDGMNIADPAADAGSSWTRLSNSSLWGTGPAMEDINQGGVSDCYFLSVLQDMARLQPGKLREMAVDLGDGTYAVQFQRNGVNSYVRVDGDLPVNQWGTLAYDRPGASGDQWASIMEKAYAYFRTGSNSYASLNWGWMTTVDSDLGLSGATFNLSDPYTFSSMLNAKLAAGKGVELGTIGNIPTGVPLVASHTYSVVSASFDSTGILQVTLRNPWGMDGFVTDSNAYDGLLTLSFGTLKADMVAGVAMS